MSRKFLSAAFGVLLAVVVACPPPAGAAPVYSAPAKTTFYAPAPAIPPHAEVVYMGIEPIQFNGISVSDERFQTSFFLWWRWKGHIDPVTTTDVLNSTNSSSNYVVNYSYTNAAGDETPITLSNGDKYQTAKVSVGVFDPFSVGHYPLDHQVLRIRFENNTYDYRRVFYVPDAANMTKRPAVEVAGWDLTGQSIGSSLHQYGTNFGVVGGGQQASQYSQVNYDVSIDRPVSHFLIKLFLPLLVAVLSTIGAVFMKQDESDVRPAVAGTGLLAIIFLQQSYSGDLPSTVPGVLMDYIYIAAYIVVGITFLRVMYLANAIHHDENERHVYLRGSAVVGIGSAVAFLVAVLILVMFR